AEALLKPVTANRTQVAFDMNAQHLFEFAAKMTRDQMERLLMHRAALDRVNWIELLQPTLNPFDQGAFAGTDRSHQIQHLAAFFAFERSGMEVTHDLGNCAFNAEKFVREEVVNLNWLVFVQALGARIVGLVNASQPTSDDHVVNTGVRHLGDNGV